MKFQSNFKTANTNFNCQQFQSAKQETNNREASRYPSKALFLGLEQTISTSKITLESLRRLV
jgi:hypothetical protein